MTGFLQRLAMRETGAAAVLRPRLPSAFEPAASYGIGAAMRGEGPIEQSEERIGTAPDRLRATAWNDAPSHDRASFHAAPSPIAPTSNLHPVSQPERQSYLQPPAPIKSLPALREAIPAASLADNRMQSPAQPLTSLIALAQPTQQSSPDRIPNRRTREDDQRDDDHPKREIAALTHQTQPMTPALLPKPLSLAPTAVKMAQAMPPQRGQESKAAQPAVHITIGRLEVRATHDVRKPAAAPARQAAQPTSLEDYLHSRNGKGRR